MSAFTKFSSIFLTDTNLFEIGEDLIYERWRKWSGIKIIVPKWFRTNFASVPAILQIFFKPQDPRWVKSSILHDYKWSLAETLKDYQDGNDIFYEAMLVEGTPKLLAILAYLSVSFSKYFYWIFAKIKKSI